MDTTASTTNNLQSIGSPESGGTVNAQPIPQPATPEEVRQPVNTFSHIPMPRRRPDEVAAPVVAKAVDEKEEKTSASSSQQTQPSDPAQQPAPQVVPVKPVQQQAEQVAPPVQVSPIENRPVQAPVEKSPPAVVATLPVETADVTAAALAATAEAESLSVLKSELTTEQEKKVVIPEQKQETQPVPVVIPTVESSHPKPFIPENLRFWVNKEEERDPELSNLITPEMAAKVSVPNPTVALPMLEVTPQALPMPYETTTEIKKNKTVTVKDGIKWLGESIRRQWRRFNPELEK